MYCRNCGNEVDPRAVVCLKCGVHPAEGTAHCPACGKDTQPAAVVCVHCGMAIPPSPSVVRARADKKLAAGICGILLGALGVHKFILGYTTAGVIMLVVSLVGGLITCWTSTAVMAIIGLVEGIVYLTKSDEEFVRTYVDQQRTWF